MAQGKKISDLIYKCLKNPELFNELKKNPKGLIEKELKFKLPQNYQLEVLEETPEKGYIVIPSRATAKEMSEDQLRAVAAGAGCSVVLTTQDLSY